MMSEVQMYPQTRLAKPTIIPEANIAYPALRDSGAYICELETLSNFVCRMIATITPYMATASQKITLTIYKSLLCYISQKTFSKKVGST